MILANIYDVKGDGMGMYGIIEAIKNDLNRQGSYDRYPVRFFTMKYAKNTANMLMKLRAEIKAVSLNSIEIVDLKDFLPHEDGWITVDNFRNHITNLEFDKSYIIVGFSEYARFLSNVEFITMIIGLLETENSSENYKRRIYIPCFALFNQIKKIVNETHRRKIIYDPFLNGTDVEDLPIIYFINESLDNAGYENEINNSSEWFGMWRNADIDVEKPIICTSKILSFFHEKAWPDNVYNIKKIITYEELLKYLYGVENIISVKYCPEKYYKQLLSLLRKYDRENLQEIILKKFNTQNITVENVYLLWKNSDEFGRWLIQNYILKYEKNAKYLLEVMNSLINLSTNEFVEKSYTCILSDNYKTEINERKVLIASINKVEPIIFTARMISDYQKYISEVIKSRTTYEVEDKIDFYKEANFLIEGIAKISDVIQTEIVPILTDCSCYERQLVIWLLRSAVIESKSIKEIYPQLSEYFEMDDLEIEKNEYSDCLTAYFNLYRRARILKNSEKEYEAELTKWNKDENSFYLWYTNNELEFPETILKKQGFLGNTYVLDGVGAEFMEYIVNVLRRMNMQIDYCAYSKSHLPSITSVAQNAYTMRNVWISDYDKKVVHGQTYYPAINLENALSVIEEMIENIIVEEGENTFAITADHGATIGHKICKREKKYDFSKSDHDGRCCLLSVGEHEYSTEDYIVYADDNSREWVISLNQQSLCNNSKYAVHGGATPEEVIIPFIIAHKVNDNSRIYRVKDIKLKVSGLDKELRFKVNPKPEKVRLQAKDTTDIWLTYDSEQKLWIGSLKRGIEQDIKVIVQNQEFNFRTVPSTKMGDDLFDD